MHKLIALNEQHGQDQDRVRREIWDLYADLKAYRRHPDPAAAAGMAQSALARLKGGENQPRAATLKRLAEAIGLTQQLEE